MNRRSFFAPTLCFLACLLSLPISLNAALTATIAKKLTLTPDDSERDTFGRRECDGNDLADKNVKFEFSIFGDRGTNTIELWNTRPGENSKCPTTPTGKEPIVDDVRIDDANFDLRIDEILPENLCRGAGIKKTEKILCLYEVAGSTKTPIEIGITYSYNTKKPDKPTLDKIKPDDKTISFRVNSGKVDGFIYEVCFGKGRKDKISGDDCPEGFDPVEKENPVIFDGLTNDEFYAFKVRVKVKDDLDNVSDWSDAHELEPGPILTPMTELDLPENALSCGQTFATPSSLLPWLLLAGFLFLLRGPKRSMHKAKYKALLLGIFVLACLPHLASAKPGQVDVGFQIAPYLPNIDASTGGSSSDLKIYRCFFGGKNSDGHGPWLPRFGLDFNVHLSDAFGSIQLGIAADYAHASGHALRAGTTGGIVDCQKQQLKDSDVGLHMLQLKPQFTYIFDPYIESFPLAPYIRLGFVGAGYIFTDDDGIDGRGRKDNPPQRPVGLRLGYQVAGGLMFMLDALEPNVAKSARSSGTYDHSFLKVEFSYMPINNFHSNGLNFSPTGLFGSKEAFMISFGLVVEFQ